MLMEGQEPVEPAGGNAVKKKKLMEKAAEELKVSRKPARTTLSHPGKSLRESALAETRGSTAGLLLEGRRRGCDGARQTACRRWREVRLAERAERDDKLTRDL